MRRLKMRRRKMRRRRRQRNKRRGKIKTAETEKHCQFSQNS